MQDLEPVGTYRPQYHVRWRLVAKILDHMPTTKSYLAERLRRILKKVFEPGLVTTERVIEYPFVFEHLGHPSGRVLDIGCCHSRLPIALASRGVKVVGMDMNQYPFPHPHLRSVQGDILSAPFSEASFEAILAISTIEHIGINHYGGSEEQEGDIKAVQEIARLLQPNGKAILTVPYGVSQTNDWMRVYDADRLDDLLSPLLPTSMEFGVSRAGLWGPAGKEEAGMIDWRGSDRAIAMVVAERSV